MNYVDKIQRKSDSNRVSEEKNDTEVKEHTDNSIQLCGDNSDKSSIVTVLTTGSSKQDEKVTGLFILSRFHY